MTGKMEKNVIYFMFNGGYKFIIFPCWLVLFAIDCLPG